jgi:hypothetical protein
MIDYLLKVLVCMILVIAIVGLGTLAFDVLATYWIDIHARMKAPDNDKT